MIICADDYGLAPGVNHAIETLVSKKKISAVSIICHTDSFMDTSDQLKSNEIDRGLHFTLTRPFFPHSFLSLRKMASREILKQLQNQWDFFEERFGHSPHFLDGHQHIHLLPNVLEAILSFDKLKSKRCYLRAAPSQSRTLHLKYGLKGMLFDLQMRSVGRSAKAKAIPNCDEIRGFRRLEKEITEKQYFPATFNPSNNTLFFTHPGFVDTILKKRDPVTDTRKQEFDFLMTSKIAPHRYLWSHNES